MTQETNIQSQQAFGDAVNAGEFDRLDELVAADSVDHDPAPGQAAGPEGYKAFFGELRTAFPDMHIEVENLVANDSDVAFAYTLTGTNDGQFHGNEPTGKAISVRGVQISRFVDGKLSERWGSSDELGIFAQLGLTP